MSVSLYDTATNEVVFDVNFWHWRAIVEAVRALGVLPDVRIDPLHQPFVGEARRGRGARCRRRDPGAPLADAARGGARAA